jgi:hypothetical protein
MSYSCQGKKTTKKFLHLSSSFLGYMLLEIAVSLLDIVFISFYLLARNVFLGILDIKISSIFHIFLLQMYGGDDMFVICSITSIFL